MQKSSFAIPVIIAGAKVSPAPFIDLPKTIEIATQGKAANENLRKITPI